MKAAVAAGHPATVDAGIEILEEGGNAADAAVAASLASCVAETVMTGLLGGGHAAVLWEGETRTLDFFVAVPGLGAERREVELTRLAIPFGTELVHYAVGVGSCGVPGVLPGLGELWRAHGSLPWPRLIEPALRLARGGVEMLPAHTACLRMLAPVMTMHEGGRIYSPGGRLLEDGDRLDQPGLVPALEAVAAEGARSPTLQRALLDLMDERGGLVTPEDLSTYEPRWAPPMQATFRGVTLETRAGLNSPLPVLASLTGPGPVKIALALRDGLERNGDTTNLTVVDGDGNTVVLTTSLGLGSGDWLPGLDVQLNSMLGEADLIVRELEPGERMASMMAPIVGRDREGLALAVGAAGGTRLRSALVQVLSGVLDDGLSPGDAVNRPRLHPVAELVHLEPGFPDHVPGELEAAGFTIRPWPAPHHYFGGVSLVTRSGAAGDPRRSGAARHPA
ncbi:MAG TPA: gamma-glutamyltransferase [Gaiellaceae bacterium]|jgi:gamma-glutamyltranspeptidase/glutathione hydrolase|nr:gamma-glutamyltransferase [Gaiellaceae bacterium]